LAVKWQTVMAVDGRIALPHGDWKRQCSAN
jgi:hypothetical protein